MAVYQLDKDLWFPDPHLGEDDGLVAIGGDLSVDRLLLAYSNGFFPWFSFKNQQEPLWFCPLQRFVIFPSEIHVSHSMQQLINKGRYKLTAKQVSMTLTDEAFQLLLKEGFTREYGARETVSMASTSAMLSLARACSPSSPVPQNWLSSTLRGSWNS